MGGGQECYKCGQVSFQQNNRRYSEYLLTSENRSATLLATAPRVVRVASSSRVATRARATALPAVRPATHVCLPNTS